MLLKMQLQNELPDPKEKQPPKVFYIKKELLKISQKFTEKHMCQGIFFNIVADLRSATLLK